MGGFAGGKGRKGTPNIEYRTPNFEVLRWVWLANHQKPVVAPPLFRNSVFGVLLFDISEANTEYRTPNTKFQRVA